MCHLPRCARTLATVAPVAGLRSLCLFYSSPVYRTTACSAKGYGVQSSLRKQRTRRREKIGIKAEACDGDTHGLGHTHTHGLGHTHGEGHTHSHSTGHTHGEGHTHSHSTGHTSGAGQNHSQSPGHTQISGLLFHSCCGSEQVPPEETNPLYRAVSAALGSLGWLSTLTALHHQRLGGGIVMMGYLLYNAPLEATRKWTQGLGFALVMIFSGLPIFRNALLQLCRLEVEASVLMSLSALGSVYLGMTGEGLLLLLLFQISHLLESKFTTRSEASFKAMLDSIPDQATLVEVDPFTMEPDMDSVQDEDIADVSVGSFVLVKPGEQVPLDGVVVFGSASVTVEHISGESLPVLVRKGSQVAAGSLNADGLLVLKTIATVEDSTPSKIANLAAHAQETKPPVHRWIDGVTTVWSKCALLAAVGIALICVSLGVPFFGARGALYRSLCIVTAAAPCALVLTPLAYVCALANASQRSILIKSTAILDVLHSCSYVALDKTGTLTEGKLICTDIVNAEDLLKNGISASPSASITGTPRKQQALCHAVDLAKRSTHPVANAVVDAGRQHLAPEEGNCRVSDFEMIPGYGVRGTILPKAERQPSVFANFGSFEFIQGQLASLESHSELTEAVDSVRDHYGKSISVLMTQDPDGKNVEWSAFCFRDELQALSRSAVAALQNGAWKNGTPNKAHQKHVSIVTGLPQAAPFSSSFLRH